MKRILITGASGLLGRPLYKVCRSQPAWQVTGTALNRVTGELVKLDLLDPPAVTHLVNKIKPDVVIHAAAERRPDRCEKDPELTEALNVGATRHLAAASRNIGAWMFYISTDYVFDGAHPPYAPDDVPHPLNAYAESKLRGEQEVLRCCPDACILRVSALFGPSESPDEGPVTSILSDLMRAQSADLELDDWAQRYPTYTPEVAEICRRLILAHENDPALAGVFHWSGNEQITRYGMGRVVSALFGLSMDRIRPHREPRAGAPRPRDVRLDCSRLEALNLVQRTPFAEAIKVSLQPFVRAAS